MQSLKYHFPISSTLAGCPWRGTDDFAWAQAQTLIVGLKNSRRKQKKQYFVIFEKQYNLNII